MTAGISYAMINPDMIMIGRGKMGAALVAGQVQRRPDCHALLRDLARRQLLAHEQDIARVADA